MPLHVAFTEVFSLDLDHDEPHHSKGSFLFAVQGPDFDDDDGYEESDDGGLDEGIY